VLAEISARQRALDEAPPQPATPGWQAASAPMADFASLERHLIHITSQIEALRRPCAVEDSVAALRADLADIARAVSDALPRRTLEGLQADMQALAARIEQGYGGGADVSALRGIEHRLERCTPRSTR
jgi:localization factor PodJL